MPKMLALLEYRAGEMAVAQGIGVVLSLKTNTAVSVVTRPGLTLIQLQVIPGIELDSR